MKFRNHATPQASFQLAPMIDIVFLLLIFFIVTWSYARFETEIEISVPAADEGSPSNRTVGEIIVNVREDGTITINATELDEAALIDKFQRIAAVHKDQAVILRGDSEAAFTHIMRVLNVCKKAGIWNVAFAATDPPKVSSP